MPVRVLLVDDSAVVRGLMAKALSADPAIVIDGTAANGQLAIGMAKANQPDVIVLDIEMPVMDGITALPELLKASPRSKIIIASTLTQRNATISMRALALGAMDYLAKPSAKNSDEVEAFYRDLAGKVKVLGSPHGVPATAKPPAATRAHTPAKPATSVPAGMLAPGTKLNPAGIRALAIASSTGGPQALLSIFEKLKGSLLHIPIFITQHMPPTFTTILAEHISKASGHTCTEAKSGQAVAPGHIYVAPGDYHMVVGKDTKGQVIVRINQDAPENFCRPAADPMLRSLSQIYGSQLAVLVLTGMGQDGMKGAKEVVNNGGSVIAQDEATCVVYGMPKAVADNKLCKAILPLPEIAAFLKHQVDGK